MKKTAFCTVIFLMTITTIFSQNDNDEIKTLFGEINKYGGYGAIMSSYSQINDVNSFIFGAKGSLIINHSFSIGLGGYGFFNDYKWNNLLESNVNLQGGCGGLYFEAIILPKFPVHISIPLFLGAGGIAYVKDNYLTNGYYSGYVYDESAFVVAEPGIELEMNVFKFMRISFGAYYRYTSDIILYDTRKDALNGLSTGINFKFGGF